MLMSPNFNRIQVEDYDPKWPEWFATIKRQIWPLIQDTALSIEHVGSTSVPGLSAKPIIDIDIIIANMEQLPAVALQLKILGYMHRGNLGIEGREAFQAPPHHIKHHLYVCLQGNAAVRNHLNLRDHLRKNPEARDEYGALKRQLATTVESISDYIEGKSAFILGVLAQYALNQNELEAIASANRASRHFLLIHCDRQVAELWEKNQLLKTYRVSTAIKGTGCVEGSLCTPTGKLRVSAKFGDGLPIGAVLRSRVPTGEVWSDKADNPLSSSSEDLVLTRLLWLEGAEERNANTMGRYIYLHGTNQENMLGQPASHGCIRFSNLDIIEVFSLLKVGSEVIVD